MTLDTLYDEWVAFADETFGKMPFRRFAVIEHLSEEVDELREAIYDEKEDCDIDFLSPHAVEEAADVFVLLCHLTSDNKGDFLRAVRAKMDKNYAREWQKPDALGVIRHVKGILD